MVVLVMVDSHHCGLTRAFNLGSDMQSCPFPVFPALLTINSYYPVFPDKQWLAIKMYDHDIRADVFDLSQCTFRDRTIVYLRNPIDETGG